MGVALWVLATGCEDIIEPLPSPLWISDIEVTGEYELSHLEVEVHLVDAVTGLLLGCAGGHSGLRNVDESDVLYSVDAEFHTPEGDLLYYEDIRYRVIEIWVLEDDLDPCPAPFVEGVDDIIGISPPIEGREFRRFSDYSFGDVVYLRMGS